MFSERLRQLMDLLEASGSETAGYAGFDRTNISRFLSGARVPKQDGAASEKLVHALYMIALKKNRLDALSAALDLPENTGKEEALRKLQLYLFEDQNETPERQAPGTAGIPEQSFGRKLDAVMNLLELTNARLSRLLYTDSSLISRYRSGARTPRQDSHSSARLCAVLWDQTVRMNRTEELARILSVPEDELSGSVFSQWLFARDESSSSPSQTAENLLEVLDRYEDFSLPVPEISFDTEHQGGTYCGYSGLREAVLRFLSLAYRRKAPQLLLYSDQDMEWMTGDPVFLRNWGILMNAAVHNGTGITIIHNIDRSLAEMNAAITGWLPLYMSGMVESFYCTSERNPRFSHTLFVMPGVAAIQAFHVPGTEAEGSYAWIDDPEELTRCEKTFRMLKKQTKPLISVSRSFRAEEITGHTWIRSALPVSSMPQDLADELGAQISAFRKITAPLMEKQLQSGPYIEFIPAGSRDMTMHTENMPGCAAVSYTQEQYERYVRHIEELMDTRPDSRFVFLPRPLFANVTAAINETNVQIIYTGARPALFTVSHPLMIRAFENYAAQLFLRFSSGR